MDAEEYGTAASSGGQGMKKGVRPGIQGGWRRV